VRVGYFASNFGEVPAGIGNSGAAVMRETGFNTGNLAFWRGAAGLVADEMVLLPWRWNGREGRDAIDVLIIPAANYLNPDWDFSDLANTIEAFAKPVLIFGLGAQAQRETQEVVLRPGTVRLLQVLSAQCDSLFVRGPFTAGVCARHGVTNVTIAGCPSITLNPDPALGQRIEQRIGRPMLRLSSAGAATKPENAPVEQALFRLIRAHPGSSLILQCPAELIDLACGRQPDWPAADGGAKYHNFFAPDDAMAAFTTEFARVALHFRGASLWIAHLAERNYSYTINTRIHGTILALMAGLPSAVLGHDARIRELCSVMAIPCLTATQILDGIDDVPALFDRLAFDGDAFDARRASLDRLYRDYLTQCGLTPSRALTNLCGTPHQLTQPASRWA
jgi:hypothetical protein